MKKFMSPKFQGQLRHALVAVGVLLAARGYGDEATWTAVAGVIMAVIGLAWSWFAPEKKA